jgi:hypothetical protein
VGKMKKTIARRESALAESIKDIENRHARLAALTMVEQQQLALAALDQAEAA